MLRKLLTYFSLLLFLLSPLFTLGQGYSITLSLPEYSNSQILITYYYFGEMYVKDTLQTDPKGQAVFAGEKPLQQGIYQIYFDKNKQVDFLIGEDQTFGISLLKKNSAPTIDSAWESEKFQQYVNFIGNQKSQYRKLSSRKEQNKSNADSIRIINTKIKQLDDEIKNRWVVEGLKYADSFYGKFMIARHTPTVEENQIPKAYLANDSLRWVYEYNFRKKHYWDHFDLEDDRMWFTPYIKERLNDYFNKVLIQQPDSVLPEAIRLIEKCKDNKLVFQNLTSFLLNNSIQSQIMGIENVFVALAEKYYFSGQAFWAEKQTLDYIRQEVEIRKYNLLGKTAKEILMEDADGEYYSLKQQTTPYTIVVFWEPGCGHCKTEIPKLYDEVFLKTNPTKLSVYAVYTMTNKSEWVQFIEKYQMQDWINVWDPNMLSDFRQMYGVRTTPAIFLLDKDKKIIAKNMDVDNLIQILKSFGVN